MVSAVPLGTCEDEDAYVGVEGAELEQEARAHPCGQLLPGHTGTVGDIVLGQERGDG